MGEIYFLHRNLLHIDRDVRFGLISNKTLYISAETVKILERTPMMLIPPVSPAHQRHMSMKI